MAEVAISEQARNDLAEIGEFIGTDSPHYAKLTLEKLLARTNALRQFPEMGRVVPEANMRSIRELIEGNYRIIYRIRNKDLVQVLRFWHSARRLRKSYVRKVH